MNTNARGLLLFVGSLVVVGLVIVGVATTQPAEPTPPATKVAYAVGWTPSPTPTPNPGVDQPIKMIWGQLPAELQAYFLRQPATVTPAPSDLIDFEVGQKGCRWTIEKNATERLAGALTGDCAELLRILNPVPPAPIVAPAPTETPTATPPAQTFEQDDLTDPRDGGLIRVYVDYPGGQRVTFMKETTPGQFDFVYARRATVYDVSGNVYTQIVEEDDGGYAIQVSYASSATYNERQYEYFRLDDLFPLAQLEPSPEPTATPTVTPTPEPTQEPEYKDLHFWFKGTDDNALVISATPGARPGTSVLSIIGYENGYLRQDEWFLTVPVFELKGATLGLDGYVYYFFTTVQGGEPIESRRQPWWMEK